MRFFRVLAFDVGEVHRQFSWWQRGLVQRQVDDALANIIRDAVPDAIRHGMLVVQGFRSTGLIVIAPAVEGRAPATFWASPCTRSRRK